jgi:hypothetical protein
MSALRRQLSYANVMATIAVFIALGGGAYALSGKNTVASDDIINGQVKADDIGGNQVKTADIAASQVTGGKVAADTLFGADIGADAIGASEVAAGAVGASEVADGTLGTAEIDEAGLFNDGSLDTADINEGTLFNDGSLDTADINEGSLFNDNSLDGGDIQETALFGLHRGIGRTDVVGGTLPLGATDVIPLAEGSSLTFTCGPAASFIDFTNQSGADARIYASDRDILFEDDGTANNGELGVGASGPLANGMTLGFATLTGAAGIGRAEAAIITDDHVTFVHVYSQTLDPCPYAIWLVEAAI